MLTATDLQSTMCSMIQSIVLSTSFQVLCVVIVTTFLVLLHASKTLSSTTSDASRPPLVPSKWPWLGNAIQYAYNRSSFVRRSMDRYGPIFRTKLGGRDATFLTTPSLIVALMRRSQQLTFYPIRALVHTRAFGMSVGAATSVDIDDQVYPVAFHPYYSKALMGATTTVFGPLLLNSFTALIARSESTFEIRLQDLIFPTFFRCSSQTSFGAGFPVDAAFLDFLVFDEGFSLLASGLPTFLFPRYRRARDNLLSVIRAHISPSTMINCSHSTDGNLSHEVAGAMRGAGWSEQDTIGHLLAFLWGSQGNTMWLTFWYLSYILVDNDRVARIRSEVCQILKECGGSIEHLVTADPAVLDAENCPLLESAMKETLRLCSEFIIARVAKEDTVFDVPDQGSYHVRKGEWVFGLPSVVHMDPDIYDSPTEFRMDRFLEADGRTARKFQKEGRRVDNSLMFWGGGGHVCKGRFVAEYEVKLFVILVIFLLNPSAVGVVRCIDGVFTKDCVVPSRNDTQVGVLHSDEDLVICCNLQYDAK
ncbi:cytochrome P450 [Sparassis latifolia]